MVNLYKLLKVEKTAESGEIRKSFYALARRVHPDKRPDDPEAAENFRALKKAYDVLMDPDRRARYDKAGSVGDPDQESSFQAAYEMYKSVEISTEDIDEFIGGYKDSEAEKKDLIEYTKRHKGDVTRILESIIGSDDSDKDRYIAIISEAFKNKDIPKKYRHDFHSTKEHIVSLDELDNEEDLGEDDDDSEEDEDSEDLSIIAEDDDDSEDDDSDDEDPEAKIDLDSDEKGAPEPEDVPSDLLALFAARRQQRESGFDAFARKWAAHSEKKAQKKKAKKTVSSSSSSSSNKRKR